ncbi:TM2 domain-containing protein [Streptomyces aidingensis]|uniref:TM2 domain-containing protein n=1 Tax=Streptomyces aidingensis TaxID=910347 RepID=A0A1I1KJJ1_9ACTN|nr:TM2 domain-containing protein [Streptomyces aidingensis]SFC61134.1 TM2 domain-containing protein [Streptomyces aidingensis]
MSNPNPYGQPSEQPGGQPGYGYPPPVGNNPYQQQPPQGQGGQPGYGYPPPGGAGYAQPGQAAYGYDPNAPYGYDAYGRPFSSKTKLVAGLLQLLVGGLGAGRFYTGHYGLAVGQLLTCGGLGIWALIDGIYLLVKEGVTDSDGRVLRSS